MSRIFKYDLDVVPRQLIHVPSGAQFLHVDVQNDLLKLWALVNPDNKHVPRIIRVVTTGEEFNSVGCVHVGSFQAAGWFVGHVFEQFELGQGDPISARFAQDFADIRSELDVEQPIL